MGVSIAWLAFLEASALGTFLHEPPPAFLVQADGHVNTWEYRVTDKAVIRRPGLVVPRAEKPILLACLVGRNQS